LKIEHADLEALWVGSETGMEAELVKRAGVRYASIPAAGLHGVGLGQLPRNLYQMKACVPRGSIYASVGMSFLHRRVPGRAQPLPGEGTPSVLSCRYRPGRLKFWRFADRVGVTSADRSATSQASGRNGLRCGGDDGQTHAGSRGSQIAARCAGGARGRRQQGRALDQ
jgi:hypothetical protein